MAAAALHVYHRTLGRSIRHGDSARQRRHEHDPRQQGPSRATAQSLQLRLRAQPSWYTTSAPATATIGSASRVA